MSAAVSAASPLASPAEHSKSAHHQDGAWHIRCGNAGMGMWMRGHTCAQTTALAVEEGSPSPAARPGPIHGMGRAIRCRAHPSRAQQASRITLSMKIAQPARERSSDGLRKRTRWSQLATPITPICGSCATLIGKWIALTFQV